MESVNIPLDPSTFSVWKSGSLAKKWYKLYPDLFDSEDLRIALSQPQYHFAEWYAAIHFYKLGWKALIEQYIYKTHTRKLAVIEKYLGLEGLSFLRREARGGKVQPPDLFLYRKHKYFFGEVKVHGDTLREVQETFFKEIEKHFNTTVKIIYLKKHV